MRITFIIETDNDAFAHGRKREVERIIREWLASGRMSDARLRDYNGNTVGTVVVEDEN